MNSGSVGERYLLKLGDGVIFDSGQNWSTYGSANNGDFDPFVIDFSWATNVQISLRTLGQ